MQGTAGNVIPPDDFLPAVQSLADGARRAAHRRRDDHRLRPHGPLVGRRALGRRARHRHDRQGVRRRLPALRASLTRDDIARRQALERPERLVVELRRQPARRCGRAPPRSAPSTRSTSSRTRATSAQRMLAALRPFVDDYPFVGEVRGRGLFLGHRARSRQEDQGAALARSVTRRIFDECVKRGLLTMAYAPSFRIQPALTIDRATAANGDRHPARGVRPRQARASLGGALSDALLAAPADALAGLDDPRARSRSSRHAVWAHRAGCVPLGERRVLLVAARRALRRRTAHEEALPRRSTRSASSGCSTTRCASCRTSGVTPETVHLCDLRAHELALFGVTMNGQRVTFHDWFQAHPSPVLDALCAIPYAHVHLRRASAARSGSTSATTRGCCASRGASSR